MVESAKYDTTITSASAPQNLEETTVKKVSTGTPTLTFFVKEGLRLEFVSWTLELNLCTGFSLRLSVLTSRVPYISGLLFKINTLEWWFWTWHWGNTILERESWLSVSASSCVVQRRVAQPVPHSSCSSGLLLIFASLEESTRPSPVFLQERAGNLLVLSLYSGNKFSNSIEGCTSMVRPHISWWSSVLFLILLSKSIRQISQSLL